jgi:regulator of RNase E activity RraA
MSDPRPNLPSPGIQLPIVGAAYRRPSSQLLQALAVVSSATASAELHKFGVRRTFIRGPVSRMAGSKIVGAAVTLQFMPQREDIASGVAQEEIEKRSALWHVLDSIEANDVLVVAAHNDPYTGTLGEMLITYLMGRGGIGAVIDGCIRDFPRVKEIGLPIWCSGLTPNYASQAGLFPWAHAVPINCGGVLVLPGDIIIADDDGVVLIPQALAPQLLQTVLDHEHWEEFSRQKLADGGSIWKYYPLSNEGKLEYEDWKQQKYDKVKQLA